MIERFKRSRFGQTVIACFVVVSVATAVIIWLYESIRIPALNERISIREDRIKALEDAAQKEGLNFANLKSISERCSNENIQLSAKFQLLQQDYAQLVNREALNSLYAATNSIRLQESNDVRQLVGFNLEQAVFSVGDQEDLSSFEIERTITELKSVSDRKYDSEIASMIDKLPNLKFSTQSDIYEYFKSYGLVIGQYFSCQLNLDALRVFATKNVHTQYRYELASIEKTLPTIFYTRIREKPEILTPLSDLATALKEENRFVGWNSNASSLVTIFMKSNSPIRALPTKGQ